MAFTDPATVPWTRASLLNELVDGINDRAPIAGSTGRGWHPLSTVTTATIIQRASFWSNMQQACQDLITDGNWAVAHSGGALIGATPAAFDATTPETAIGTYANLGAVSTAMGVSFWRARDDNSGWDAAGQTVEHDVVNAHLITDLQSVLKALIWTKHSITWLVDGSEITGGGADVNATKGGAMTAAIAAYATPAAATEPTSSYPHGIVGYAEIGGPPPVDYDGWASRSKNKGQITLVTGLECDIYWFGYPQRWTAGAPNEWSDQDSGAASLTENTWKHWETEGVTPGATPRTSSTHFGDYDFANSPTDKPDTTTTGARRGWTVQTGEDCAVIDWRDSITHYE